MDRAEKRNFKLLTQLTSGDKKYLLLFDAIDRQKEYDESKVIRQIKDSNFTRQFSVAKNYLYNSILRSLGYFHKGPKAELNNLLSQINILLEKNLQPLAYKLLRKAKEKAKSQERLQELLLILQMERELLQEMQQYKKFGAFIGEIEATEKETISQLENLGAFNRLFDEVVRMTKTVLEARSKVEKNDFANILSNPLMEGESQALTLKAKVIYWLILDYIHRSRFEMEKCIECATRAIELMDSNVNIREELIQRYVQETHNLAVYFTSRRDMKKSLEILESMKSIPTKNQKARLLIFEKYYQLRLGQSHVMGEIETGMEILRTYEEQSGSFEEMLSKPEELFFYFTAARFCVTAGDFSAALKWINRFLNEPRTEIRSDLQCFARILNLLIHYEMGNYDVMGHGLKATYRFIYKRERMFGIERAVLKFIRSLNFLDPKQDLTLLFVQFKEQIEELGKDPMEGPAYRLLDLTTWLQSKIEAVPIAELKRQQFAHELNLRDERLRQGAKY